MQKNAEEWWEIGVTDWTCFLRAVADTYIMLTGLVCSGPVLHQTAFHTFHLLLFALRSKLIIGQRLNQSPKILERDALPFFHIHILQDFAESFLVPCCLKENKKGGEIRGCGKLRKSNIIMIIHCWPNAFTGLNKHIIDWCLILKFDIEQKIIKTWNIWIELYN